MLARPETRFGFLSRGVWALIGLCLVAMPARVRAQPPTPDPSGRVMRTRLNPEDTWVQDGGYRDGSTDPHLFLGGGFVLLVSGSSSGPLVLGRVGELTGGAELATGRDWAFVPRLHFSTASGGGVGAIRWTRLALDGRLFSRSGAFLNYQELGVGMGYCEYPVSVTDAAFNSHIEERFCGTPFAQYAIGKRGVPFESAPLMIELVVAAGFGAARPSEIALVTGIVF